MLIHPSDFVNVLVTMLPHRSPVFVAVNPQPPIHRPYAPESARYPRPHLIPCKPLSHRDELALRIVPVEQGDETALYDLMLPFLGAQSNSLLAAYRVECHRDGSREWFRYVTREQFAAWLEFDDDATPADFNVERLARGVGQ